MHLESECDTELYTLNALHEQMYELVGGDEVYCSKRPRQRLQDYHGDHVFFAKIQM